MKSRFLSLCHHLNLYFLNIKSRKGSSWGGGEHIYIYIYDSFCGEFVESHPSRVVVIVCNLVVFMFWLLVLGCF